jgi:hypothetical protein
MWGYLGWHDLSTLYYSVTFDDHRAQFGFSSRIGLYDLEDNTVRSLFSTESTYQVLGASADKLSLFLLPMGQDTNFASISVLSIATGDITQQMDFKGQIVASLSPDSHCLATLSLDLDSAGQPVSALDLYDLSQQSPFASQSYPLPNPPVNFNRLLWSPDSQYLYLKIDAGSPWEDRQETIGLWQFDPAGGSYSIMDNNLDEWNYIDSISPGGNWLLMRHEQEDGAFWINVLTGQRITVDLPVDAAIVRTQ